MIAKLATLILEFIYTYSDLSPDIKDIYQYGIEITLSSILNIVLVIGFSLILGDTATGILFLVIFIFVRSFTGGYHAPTYFRCNALMLLTFLTTFFVFTTLYRFEIRTPILIAIIVLNMIPIIVFSPVSNFHKLTTEQIRKRSRDLAIAISLLLSILGLILIHFDVIYGYLIIVTISAISVMMIIEILMQRRRYNEGKEGRG